MLKVEENFIYQRRGQYEIILNKIGDKERTKSQDELQRRVDQQQRQQQMSSSSGGFAPQKEEEKEAEQILSYVEKQLALYEAKVIEEDKKTDSSGAATELMEDDRIVEQAQTMLKSIFAYWCVFSLRFVDNLHQRIKYNLLFRIIDGFTQTIGDQYMPSGGSEFAERVVLWMEEPPQQA